MAKDLLIEIGTEEMPASFLRPVISQIEDLLKSSLTSELLNYENLRIYATPRRLVAYIENLEEFQKSREEEIRGPAEKIAYKDGNWLPPAVKFSEQYNASLEDLYIKNTEKGSYVFLKRKIYGKPTKEILPKIINELIASLRFPKMMKWGDIDFSFGRPIRWLLILYGEEVIDFEIAKVKSSNFTYTPRFLKEERLEVKNPKDYFNVLEKNFVIVDHEERKREILKQAENLAKEKEFVLDYSEDLLEELIFLVEYPTAFLGEFDEKYLSLPETVLIITMEKKQRYFPLRNSQGNLVNFFIGIRNGTKDNIELVKEGNERVLKARLSDAEYYFNEDIKSPLEKYTEKLSGIIFHEKLGSIKDKMERVKKLALNLREKFNLKEEEKKILERAVEIYKADLGTLMVGEYPELHGIIGGIYARYSGEREEVSKILQEYFLPRTSEDKLSEYLLANILGIADRVDSLMGYFSLDLFPTGSEDPIGLRRLTNGLIRILWEKEYDLTLRELFDLSWEIYNFNKNKEEVWRKAEEFLIQRIRNFLLEKDYSLDIINGVLALDFDPLFVVKNRINTLLELRKNEDLYDKIYTSANRLFRIIPKNFNFREIREDLFKTQEEKTLYRRFLEINKTFQRELQEKKFLKILESELMKDLVNDINNFFDKVLIMSEIEEERENRLSLVYLIKDFFWKFVDWSKLVKV